MTAGPMSATLAHAAERLAATGGPAGEAGTAAAALLHEPLRVAVVGRVSTGKSTLVNALLGRVVAPTGAGETTRVPCWFRHSMWTTAQLRRGDGTVVPVTLPDGHLPDQLPVPAEDPDTQLEVTLPVDLLTTATVVDTPGIASATDEVSARTAALLSAATVTSAGRAEALVVVLSGPLRADEASAVAQLVDSVPNGVDVPAVGVLTRVDHLDVDPARAFAVGAAWAADLAREHADLFATVVPVAGLLAETAATAALTETDARHLNALATEVPPAVLDAVLDDARLLAELDLSAVPLPARARLIALLGQPGIRLCTQHLRRAPGAGAGALTDLLLARSGLAELVDALRAALADRADLLKAAVAAHTLFRAMADPQMPRQAADQLADALDEPALFPLQLMSSLTQLRRSVVPLPDSLAEQVRAVRDGRLPPATASEAATHAGQWRGWALRADGYGKRAAEAMCHAWDLAVEGAAR